MDLLFRATTQKQIPRYARDDSLWVLKRLWISNRKSLGRDLNCQLEAAGIAGTRTPSAAASNYQLKTGWISASLVDPKLAGKSDAESGCVCSVTPEPAVWLPDCGFAAFFALIL